MISKLIKPIKYAVSGGSAAMVEYAIFTLLLALVGPRLLVICQSVSFLTGGVTSFSLNKFWVFRSSGKIKGEAVRYLSLSLINLVISNFILWGTVNVVHVPALYAKIITMGTIAVWNFVVLQKVIFKNKEPSPAP